MLFRSFSRMRFICIGLIISSISWIALIVVYNNVASTSPSPRAFLQDHLSRDNNAAGLLDAKHHGAAGNRENH